MAIEKENNNTEMNDTQPNKTSSPKLKNLGTPLGYLFTLYSIIVFFFAIILVWAYGIYGFMFSYVTRALAFWIDEKTSNATELNKKVLEKNGYNAEEIFKWGKIKGLLRGLFHFPFFRYFTSDVEVYFSYKLVFNIFLGLLLTEIYFTIAHRWMHRYRPETHKLHHCCLYPSLTSNLVFDELDLWLELTVPMYLVFIVLCKVIKDSFAGMLAVCIINSWYTISHDEYFKNHHYYHHKYINSKYNAYVETGEFDDKDKVKGLVIR